MKYNVAQLLKEPVGATRLHEIDDPSHIGDGPSIVLQRGKMSMMRTDIGIWVSAKLELQVEVTCSRCLSWSQLPIRIAVGEEYLPTVDIKTGRTLLVPEGAEDSFTIDQRHTLDLGEALRQYALTNEPMKPLCSPNCRGLCPICGINKNENPCACQKADSDLQWSPFLELVEERQPMTEINSVMKEE